MSLWNGSGFEPIIEKRKVSPKERQRLAATGDAMPDGSYPIANRSDLENAIRSWGRGGAREDVKRHIISRARELGAEDLIPDNWKSPVKKDDAAGGGDVEGAEEAGESTGAISTSDDKENPSEHLNPSVGIRFPQPMTTRHTNHSQPKHKGPKHIHDKVVYETTKSVFEDFGKDYTKSTSLDDISKEYLGCGCMECYDKNISCSKCEKCMGDELSSNA